MEIRKDLTKLNKKLEELRIQLSDKIKEVNDIRIEINIICKLLEHE